MSRVYDLFVAGGPVMYPLLGLLIATFACAFERLWFWFGLTSQEDRVVHDVLEAAGMIVATIALFFFRIFVSLQSQQMDYFSRVGSQLELIYRQVWYESAQGANISQRLPEQDGQ